MHWHILHYYGGNAAREWEGGREYVGDVTQDRAKSARLRINSDAHVSVLTVEGYDGGLCDDRCGRFTPDATVAG